jgi:uncharacterized protein YoxC
MFSELQAIANLVLKFGYAGISLVLLGIVVYLLRKLATNHLHHIDMKLDAIQASVKTVSSDVEKIKNSCGNCKERIATLEGKLE